MKTIEVVITHEESQTLEKLHYCVDSRIFLIQRLCSGKIIIDDVNEVLNKIYPEYDDYYKKYSKYKDFLTEKYRPQNAINWVADFEEEKLIFEVEEC